MILWYIYLHWIYIANKDSPTSQRSTLSKNNLIAWWKDLENGSEILCGNAISPHDKSLCGRGWWCFHHTLVFYNFFSLQIIWRELGVSLGEIYVGIGYILPTIGWYVSAMMRGSTTQTSLSCGDIQGQQESWIQFGWLYTYMLLQAALNKSFKSITEDIAQAI